MTGRSIARAGIVAALAGLCAVWAGAPRLAAQDVGTDAQRASGQQLYTKYCAQCHGDEGNGEGYATSHLYPRPRDFTTGRYKVRTTPNGALPTHQDLVNIIRRGMPYTSMPAWPALSDADVSNLAYHLKTFAPAFADADRTPTPIELPSAPSATDETVAQGKALYTETGCVRCHGTLGRGDGPSAPTLTDETNHPIRTADLSQPWTFRGGSSRADIYRTMSTGFNGTPMPSFADSLSPEQRWAITDYILSLSGGSGPDYTNIVIARRVDEPIDLAKGAANFASAPVARFPVVGQVVEPVRAFHPAATNVMVQAIRDATSLAVLVRWHDMSAQTTGTNGPDLSVPLDEEEAPAAASASADDPFGDAVSDDPFGDAVADDPFGDAVVDPFAEATGPAAPASEFSDAIAIQWPAEAPTGARKPYFLFGDERNAVDLWFFDLATDAPARYTARSSLDIAPAELADLNGVASYENGEWSVMFVRPLDAEADTGFAPGAFMPIAFSVWDGFSRERGNKRGITVWYSLYVEPDEVPSAAGPMVRTALIVLGLELAVIAWVRSSRRQRANGKLGQRPGEAAPTGA